MSIEETTKDKQPIYVAAEKIRNTIYSAIYAMRANTDSPVLAKAQDALQAGWGELPDVDKDLLKLALSTDWQEPLVTIYLCVFDENGQIRLNPRDQFIGANFIKDKVLEMKERRHGKVHDLVWPAIVKNCECRKTAKKAIELLIRLFRNSNAGGRGGHSKKSNHLIVSNEAITGTR